MLFGKVMYFELRHDGLTARCPPNAQAPVDTSADPAFRPADIAAAFGHERLLIADIHRAAGLFGLAIAKLNGPRALIKPVVILRLCHRFTVSITALELQALRAALEYGGARRSYLWIGRELSDDEIRRRRFPPDGLAISEQDLSFEHNGCNAFLTRSAIQRTLNPSILQDQDADHLSHP